MPSRSHRSPGFTLIEVLLAGSLGALVVIASILYFNTLRYFYPTAGTVIVSGKNYEYAPSPSQQLVADVVFTQFREDDGAAAQVVVVDRELSPSFVPTSGRLDAVLNAPAYNLSTPSLASSYLASRGVTFTTNTGFTFFFLSLSGNVIASYSCSYVDSGGLRTYVVRRATYPNTTPLSYSFVEPTGKTQPVPTLVLGSVGVDSGARAVLVNFPDPACRYSINVQRLDTITDLTTRATAVANLSVPSRYEHYVFYRR